MPFHHNQFYTLIRYQHQQQQTQHQRRQWYCYYRTNDGGQASITGSSNHRRRYEFIIPTTKTRTTTLLTVRPISYKNVVLLRRSYYNYNNYNSDHHHNSSNNNYNNYHFNYLYHHHRSLSTSSSSQYMKDSSTSRNNSHTTDDSHNISPESMSERFREQVEDIENTTKTSKNSTKDSTKDSTYQNNPPKDDRDDLDRWNERRLRQQLNNQKDPNFKKPWEYDEHNNYDPIEDYYIDRSTRFTNQFTILHYDKARDTLNNFIQTNHLQRLRQTKHNENESNDSHENPNNTNNNKDKENQHQKLFPTIDSYTNPQSSSVSQPVQPQQPVSAASAVNACINLLELVYYELGECNTLPRTKIREISEYFCQPRFYNPIFNAWKFISLHYIQQMKFKYGKDWKQYEPEYQHYGTGEPQTIDQYDCIEDDLNIPIPGRIVLQKIIRMSHYLSRFEYDISTINIILQVIIAQCTSINKAPYIAENVIDYIIRHKKSNRRTYSGKLYLDVYTYNILLNVWCESTIPNAYIRINYYRQQMKVRNIQPNIVIYNTLLKFWGKKGSIQQLNNIIKEMEEHEIVPDISCRSLLIYGYVQTVPTIPLGVQQFQCMMDQVQYKSLDRRNTDLIQKSAHYILDAYRKQVIYQHSSNHTSTNINNNTTNTDINTTTTTTPTFHPYLDGKIIQTAEMIIELLHKHHLLNDQNNYIHYSIKDGGGMLLLFFIFFVFSFLLHLTVNLLFCLFCITKSLPFSHSLFENNIYMR
jgi:pentatricopeptide repeat protein